MAYRDQSFIRIMIGTSLDGMPTAVGDALKEFHHCSDCGPAQVIDWAPDYDGSVLLRVEHCPHVRPQPE